jgi:biotin transport system substrate-specific component
MPFSGATSSEPLSAAGTLLDAVTVTGRRALQVAERAGAVAFVTALTAAAAQVSVPLPFTPVPFTFQPMIVLLGGAALGARLGMASQLLYLALGIAGLPVFAASPVLPPGAARLLGPTGGYLLSYPLAAFAAGWLAAHGLGRRYLTAVLAMGAGLAVLFGSGVLWLAFVVRPGAGLHAALASGFFPFIAADVVKLLCAAAILPAAWTITGRRAS